MTAPADPAADRPRTVTAYLQLARPANIVTAWADVAAGFAASGMVTGFLTGLSFDPAPLGWLLLATTGLYGGGVVFNDVFDAALDAEERPERPIPSGRASRSGAALFGGLLLLGGVAAAWQVNAAAGLLALGIAAGALVYDAFGKHHALLGPLNMGLCRGGNLLLGVAAVPALVGPLWFIGLLPVFYIAAITAVSRGEVHGGTRGTGGVATGLVATVTAGLLLLGLRPDYRLPDALLFVALFALQVVPPFVRAARQPRPDLIRKAVRAGILALIPLDAALAAGFAGWAYGMAVLLLLPVSLGLARLFSVT